jgi:hypothetical protein
MLNGALAAMIAPKLAMDAKLDLSKALGGTTAKNMGKTPDKLAAKIVAATKGKLAQDAELDVSDVVEIIGALSGSTAEMTEDEDKIDDAPPAADPDDKNKPTADADGDMVAKIMAFVKGKLSDEDMAKLGEMASGGASDDMPDDMAGDDEPDDKPKEKPAMDAATVRRTVAKTISDLRTAEREVSPIIGEVKIACDSAADVYKLALDHAKVDTTGVHPSAYRAMVRMIPTGAVAAPVVAMDRATVANDFAARFPGASTLLAV